MNYWLDLFTVKTLEEFQKAGAKVSGFRERRFHTCEQIQPGDKLLCYVTGISRWVGVLRVTKPVYRSEDRIWDMEVFPDPLGRGTGNPPSPRTRHPAPVIAAHSALPRPILVGLSPGQPDSPPERGCRSHPQSHPGCATDAGLASLRQEEGWACTGRQQRDEEWRAQKL